MLDHLVRREALAIVEVLVYLGNAAQMVSLAGMALLGVVVRQVLLVSLVLRAIWESQEHQAEMDFQVHLGRMVVRAKLVRRVRGDLWVLTGDRDRLDRPEHLAGMV